MNSNPLISVIIPLYNREKIIKESIDSVLQQTYENLELIIVDDGSTDESLLIAKELEKIDSRIQVFERPKDWRKGANSCRNYGLKQAKGTMIKWLDSDDLLLPTALELQEESMRNLDVNLSICRSINFSHIDNQDQLLEEWGNVLSEQSVSNFIFSRFKWHTCSGLWRKSYFDKDNLWNIDLMNSQEWLFHLEALANGVSITVVDEILCKIRVHAGSMSNKKHKRGRYHYHECWARFKAIQILNNNKFTQTYCYYYLLKKTIRYHVFIFYKGNPRLGIEAFRFYPRFIYGLLLSSVRK